MADINLNPYTSESEAIAKKLRMAELLQQQAMQPIETPTMPGVRVSPLSGLAKLLQAYGASKQSERATEEQKALAQRYQGDISNDFQAMIRALQAPAQAGQPAIEPTFQEGQSTITQGGQAAIPARPAGYLPAEGLSGIKTEPVRQAYMAQLLAQATPKPLEIKSRNPEEDLYRVVDGKVEILSAGKPKATLPKWEKSSIFENGQEVTGWVNTNAPDIPSSFVKGATKPEMTEPQRLDAELKLFQAKVEADKAQDVGRKPTVFERLPKGVPVGSKRVGKSPDGKDVYELNGKKYVGE